MSKAKKLLTIASIGAFLPVLGKNVRKLYPNTSAVSEEIPDAMGYTAAMHAEAVFVQSEKLENRIYRKIICKKVLTKSDMCSIISW